MFQISLRKPWYVKDDPTPEPPKEKPEVKIICTQPPKLRLSPGQTLLFEYGDMMAEMPKHPLLGKDADLLQPAFSEPKFSLWNKRQGLETFPIALNLCSEKIARAKVFGQLYRLPSELLKEVDNRRETGILFKRKLVPLIIPYWEKSIITDGKRDQKLAEHPATRRTFAWMYVGLNSTWAKPVTFDQDMFWNRGGSNFGLAHMFKDWTLNRNFYRFTEDWVDEKDPYCRPLSNPWRYFRTRTSSEQHLIQDLDIEEEMQYQKQRILGEKEAEQTYPTSRLS